MQGDLRDVARHGLGGATRLSPPKHKYSPPPKLNEAHWPFCVWTYVFCFFHTIFGPFQKKLLQILLAQTSADISPPQTKNPGYVPAENNEAPS